MTKLETHFSGPVVDSLMKFWLYTSINNNLIYFIVRWPCELGGYYLRFTAGPTKEVTLCIL